MTFSRFGLSEESRVRRGSFVIGAALLLLVTACAPPTSSDPTDDSSGTTTANAADLDLEGVYSELEGLEGEERGARLLELAQAEEGGGRAFVLYYSVQEGTEWIEAFQEKTGITVEVVQTSPTNILQRLVEEEEAGFTNGADVVLNSAGEMDFVVQEHDLFLPIRTPVAETIDPRAVKDTYLGVYWAEYVIGWNSDAMEAPTGWEDLLTNYEDRILFEVTAWDWFATIVKDWMVPEMGMTQEEALDLWRQGSSGGTGVAGRTFASQLLVSGEYDVAAHLFITRTEEFKAEGAPLEWQPAIEPVVLRGNGIGITKHTDRPATSLLFAEFLLTDAQEIMLEQGTTGTSNNIEFPANAGGYASLPIRSYTDPEMVDENWQQIYQDVVVNNLGETLEEEEG